MIWNALNSAFTKYNWTNLILEERMPGFTPGRRWQQAYYPFKKMPFADSTMISLER